MNLDRTYGSLTHQDDGKEKRAGTQRQRSPGKVDNELSAPLQSLNLKLDQLTSIMGEFRKAMASPKRPDSQECELAHSTGAACLESGATDSVLVYRLCSLIDFLRELYDFDDAGVFLCNGEGQGIKALVLSPQSAGDESSGELEGQMRILWEKGDIQPAISQEKRHTFSIPEGGRFLMIPFRIMGASDGFWVMHFRRDMAPGKRWSADMVLWTEIISSCIENSWFVQPGASPRGGDSDHMEKERIYTATQLGRALTHEINNPLQVIMGRAQLLRMNRRKSPGSSASDKILDAMENSAGRICSLIKDFSDHLHRQSVPMSDRGEVNLLHILTSDLALITYLLNSRKIKLETDLPGSLPSVFGNPGELEMAVLSLIWELESRLSSGGSISIRASADGRCVRLEVHGVPGNGSTESPDPAGMVSGDRVNKACRLLEKVGGSLELEDGPGDETGFCMKFAALPAGQVRGEARQEMETPDAGTTRATAGRSAHMSPRF